MPRFAANLSMLYPATTSSIASPLPQPTASRAWSTCSPMPTLRPN